LKKKFIGHSKDVLSVAINKENKYIVSGSRDKSIKIWNSIGENTSTLQENGHTGWVSSVKFSPDSNQIISSGWDRVVKIWNFKNHKLQANLIGHQSFINSVTVSPDGSLCASGGKDGVAMLWDLKKGEHLYSLDQDSQIHSLAFSPNKYWLCAATDKNIRVWDLEKKETIAELIPESIQTPSTNPKKKNKKEKRPVCVSLCWSQDGTTLFSGYTDNIIRVWSIYTSNN
jgi:guanine nucleotide-binding protein subunit beta-2-like 1 protein